MQSLDQEQRKRIVNAPEKAIKAIKAIKVRQQLLKALYNT